MASVKKRPDGRWRARYRDDSGKEHARHFPRKTDADTWLAGIASSKITGTYVDPRAGRVTFEDFYTQWSARKVWLPGTVAANDLVRRTVPFKASRMSSIGKPTIEAWVKEMDSSGLAPNTIGQRMNVVRAVMRGAVEERVIADDPTVGVKLPRSRRRDAAMNLPTTGEVGALLAASEGHMRAFVGVCAFAGLRLGEASGLQVGDVDFVARTLTVHRQVQRRPGGPAEVVPPKYEQERTIFVPDELLEMLRVHAEEIGVGATGWFFPAGGRPVPPTTVHSWWQRTLEAAGVDGVKIHGLRHFYASGLIAAGCDVVTVQRSLGHSKPSVTLDTYSHLWHTAEDKTRAAASGLAAAVLADSGRTE